MSQYASIDLGGFGLAWVIGLFLLLTFAVYGVLRSFAKTGVGSIAASSILLTCSLVAVFLVWFATPFIVPRLASFVISIKNPGEFGDMFGAATALFSGLAFIGLIWTLLVQKEELSYQRQELAETRAEFQRQRFESSLFSIIQLFLDHTAKFEIENLDDEEGASPTTSVLKGRAVLEYYASELPSELTYRRVVKNGTPELVFQSTGLTTDELVKGYIELYEIMFEADMGPYFRLLYQSIRHIEHSSLGEEEKVRYSKIVRAHLSSPELKLLLFNCLSPMGEGFKIWVEKYSLLKHIRPEDKAQNVSLIAKYHPIAFGLD